MTSRGLGTGAPLCCQPWQVQVHGRWSRQMAKATVIDKGTWPRAILIDRHRVNDTGCAGIHSLTAHPGEHVQPGPGLLLDHEPLQCAVLVAAYYSACIAPYATRRTCIAACTAASATCTAASASACAYALLLTFSWRVACTCSATSTTCGQPDQEAIVVVGRS
jgi:hypothetical protein